MATSIRLPEGIENRLNLLAEKTGRTKAYYIREMFANHLEEMEDYYLAANVLERVRRGKEEVFSSTQVRKELDLDD